MGQFGFFKDRPPVLLIGSGISKRYLERAFAFSLVTRTPFAANCKMLLLDARVDFSAIRERQNRPFRYAIFSLSSPVSTLQSL